MGLKLVLYSTDCCHLCDIAKEILINNAQHLPVEIAEQDIAFSDELMNKYGTKIPVLKNEVNKDELCWPFNDMECVNWLNAQLHKSKKRPL